MRKYSGVPCISKDDRIPHHWSLEASDTSYTRVKVESYSGVPCISKDDRIPHHWSSEASDTSYTRVKAESDSSEFKEVETLFRKTMKEDKMIDSFERVENLFLWETYSR